MRDYRFANVSTAPPAPGTTYVVPDTRTKLHFVYYGRPLNGDATTLLLAAARLDVGEMIAEHGPNVPMSSQGYMRKDHGIRFSILPYRYSTSIENQFLMSTLRDTIRGLGILFPEPYGYVWTTSFDVYRLRSNDVWVRVGWGSLDDEVGTSAEA